MGLIRPFNPLKLEKNHFPIQKWFPEIEDIKFRIKYHKNSSSSDSIHFNEVAKGQIAQNIMKIGLVGL